MALMIFLAVIGLIALGIGIWASIKLNKDDTEVNSLHA